MCNKRFMCLTNSLIFILFEDCNKPKCDFKALFFCSKHPVQKVAVQTILSIQNSFVKDLNQVGKTVVLSIGVQNLTDECFWFKYRLLENGMKYIFNKSLRSA